MCGGICAQWDQNCHFLDGHTRPIISGIFSPDSCRVTSASEDSTIRFWDVQDGTQYHIIYAQTSSASGVVFSPDGTKIAAWCPGAFGNAIQMWDVTSGGQLKSLDIHSGVLRSFVFQPDRNRIISAGSNGLVMWDVASGGDMHCSRRKEQVSNSEIPKKWNGSSPAHHLPFFAEFTDLADGNENRLWAKSCGMCPLF